MLRTNKSGVFSCAASILLFSRSQFCEAATFPWIWTVWLKLPPIVTKEFVRGGGIGFCCSRESMCVKYYGNSGQYSPERETLPVSAFSHTDKSWQREKLRVVIQLLHSSTHLTSCMIQRFHIFLTLAQVTSTSLERRPASASFSCSRAFCEVNKHKTAASCKSTCCTLILSSLTPFFRILGPITASCIWPGCLPGSRSHASSPGAHPLSSSQQWKRAAEQQSRSVSSVSHASSLHCSVGRSFKGEPLQISHEEAK